MNEAPVGAVGPGAQRGPPALGHRARGRRDRVLTGVPAAPARIGSAWPDAPGSFGPRPGPGVLEALRYPPEG